MRNLVGLACSFLLVACSSDGLSTNNVGSMGDLATSSTTDLPTKSTEDLATKPSPDAAVADASTGVAGTVTCGAMSCNAGDSCCVTPNNGSPTYACMTTCGPGTIAASCDGPEDCETGACCATVGLAGGSPSGMASCQSPTNDCSMGSINAGQQSITTRVCHSGNDCAGYMGSSPFGGGSTAYSSCCTYSGVSYMFCAPPMINGVFGITCN